MTHRGSFRLMRVATNVKRECGMRADLIHCFALIANLSSASRCTAQESWWQLLGPVGNTTFWQ